MEVAAIPKQRMVGRPWTDTSVSQSMRPQPRTADRWLLDSWACWMGIPTLCGSRTVRSARAVALSAWFTLLFVLFLMVVRCKYKSPCGMSGPASMSTEKRSGGRDRWLSTLQLEPSGNTRVMEHRVARRWGRDGMHWSGGRGSLGASGPRQLR